MGNLEDIDITVVGVERRKTIPNIHLPGKKNVKLELISD